MESFSDIADETRVSFGELEEIMELKIKELNIILGALNCYMEKDLPKDLKEDAKALRELIKKRIKQQ